MKTHQELLASTTCIMRRDDSRERCDKPVATRIGINGGDHAPLCEEHAKRVLDNAKKMKHQVSEEKP